MLLYGRPPIAANIRPRHLGWLVLVIVLCLLRLAHCMTDGELHDLKRDARFVFYHGLTNYHRYAYPEDELRPLTCDPLTRDRANPAHIEVNDVLGNYSLSVVDSLSTLAILASSPISKDDDHNALHDFQRYISLLVGLYGDGSEGSRGTGSRARGFDLDSKVQVFETTIRGVGGLLSAHLFAIGDLPIRGYVPAQTTLEDGRQGILWETASPDVDSFLYDGQLLRLALDLAKRLLPAFHTPTGIPYPRVNLRHGAPFYDASPLNDDAEHGQCRPDGAVNKTIPEITETCSAGAGSLVLEFTTLSRLTGDPLFERLAKRAFWAVWERRSATGLLGAGIDAETGQWTSPYTGIGAGIDSFFEYALKTHVLLSGDSQNEDLSSDDDADAFLQTWEDAHTAIRRHIYRGPQFQHPHYAQNDLWTGAPRLGWIDSLSAYYPGLLTLAGELEEAISSHLLYTAVWTRFGALPERWNTFTGQIEGGLSWWGGRPEFIESTWYLYRATQDPWYLHVGEMTIRDIKNRCFTQCGWAGLQDVQSGELSNRMESFFLGETAKYLYLLFDVDHPLNHLDAPFVFTTEGHPLIIPKSLRRSSSTAKQRDLQPERPTIDADVTQPQCAVAPAPIPFTVSATAARHDVFHAAALARLHMNPRSRHLGSPLMDLSVHGPSIGLADVRSPTNYTHYPWTLPLDLVPHNGMSGKMLPRQTFDLTFPVLPNTVTELGSLQRIDGGILIKSVSGLRLGLVLDNDQYYSMDEFYRVYALSNLALGRDESIYLSAEAFAQINPTDPHFTRYRDREIVDLVIDAPKAPPFDAARHETSQDSSAPLGNGTFSGLLKKINPWSKEETGSKQTGHQDQVVKSPAQLAALQNQLLLADGNLEKAIQSIMHMLDSNIDRLQVQNLIDEASRASGANPVARRSLPATLPTGPGAAAMPSALEDSQDPSRLGLGKLTIRSIFVLDDTLCSPIMPATIVRRFNVLVVRRGGCSFSEKIASIPSFAPSARALQLIIIVSFPDQEDELSGTGDSFNIRPYIDKVQTTPAGVERRNPIPMIMVSGGHETWEMLRRAALATGFVVDGELVHDAHVRETVNEQDVQSQRPIGSGLGVKTRYWFTSQGIRISNLFVL